MKLWVTVVLAGVAALGWAADDEKKKALDLSGAWTFMWEDKADNTNPATLKHAGGVISGTYVNDSKDKCAIAGRMTSAVDVMLMVVCPGWDIKCEGSVSSSGEVSGTYLAYGDSKGVFKLTRSPEKKTK